MQLDWSRLKPGDPHTMARARAFTAGYSAASTLADRALATTGGADLIFSIHTHGSPAACAAAARSFTQLFSAMRAQDRNRTPHARNERKANGGIEPAFTFARSDYDSLICTKKPLADGSWMVSLLKGEDYISSIIVLDHATGEEIKSDGSRSEPAKAIPAPLINSEFDPLNVSLDDMFKDYE